MSLITKMRKQKAVLWVSNGKDAFGQLSYSAPVEISCRWEEKIEEYIAFDGSKSQSRAVVYVDRVLAAGSILKRGTLESLGTNTNAKQSGAWEVRGFSEIPNLKATEYLRTVYL